MRVQKAADLGHATICIEALLDVQPVATTAMLARVLNAEGCSLGASRYLVYGGPCDL